MLSFASSLWTAALMLVLGSAVVLGQTTSSSGPGAATQYVVTTNQRATALLRQNPVSDRFSAGVTDNIEVLQAQQSVASANESLISSLRSYNVSKIGLGRAIGDAEAGDQRYLKGR